jgi:hypothetical protein
MDVGIYGKQGYDNAYADPDNKTLIQSMGHLADED